ncbi:MAG: hypothetical protein FJZ15_07770, partial [Candidatus Omnitrophica bacterium]|nr:hypothetical protein [Candidatus Omnitrophota bacterium]
MGRLDIISELKNKLPDFNALWVSEDYPDELNIRVSNNAFKDTCSVLHKILPSPMMMLFAVDERKEAGRFIIKAVFASFRSRQWIIVSMDIPQEDPCFESMAK